MPLTSERLMSTTPKSSVLDAMDGPFDPASVEGRLYEMWQNAGYFQPSYDLNRIPFTIAIPPPNITGQQNDTSRSSLSPAAKQANQSQQDRGLVNIPRRSLRGKGHLWHPKCGRPRDRAASSRRSAWRHRPPDRGRPRHADDRRRQPSNRNPSRLPQPPGHEGQDIRY